MSNSVKQAHSDAMQNLKGRKCVLKSLDEIPSKPTNSSSKGQKFVDDYLGGSQSGLYFAYLKDDLIKEDGKQYRAEELLNDLEKLYEEDLYSGKGNTLERTGKMRGKTTSQDPHPVARYLADKGLTPNDVVVLMVSVPEKDQGTWETARHHFCEERRKDKLRFTASPYSKSNGETGVKQSDLENLILQSVTQHGMVEGHNNLTKITEQVNKARILWNTKYHNQYDVVPK